MNLGSEGTAEVQSTGEFFVHGNRFDCRILLFILLRDFRGRAYDGLCFLAGSPVLLVSQVEMLANQANV